jgi:hypothetical protein
MTRTLDIPTDLDAQIQAAARAQNTDAGAWLLQAARRALDPDAALDALLDTLPDYRAAAGLAPLSDEQVSRAAFYDDGADDEERL